MELPIDNQLVQLLLDKKANPAELTGEGYSAMHIAADRGNLDAIRLLLLHGAEKLPTEGAPWLKREPSSVINEPDHGVELEYEQARRSLRHAHCEPAPLGTAPHSRVDPSVSGSQGKPAFDRAGLAAAATIVEGASGMALLRA